MSRKPSSKAKQPPATPAGGGRVRIQIQNLGRIKSADIEIAPLTIIAGPNSTGKTYLNYLISTLLSNAVDLSHEIQLDEDLGEPALSNMVSFKQLDAARVAAEEQVGAIYSQRAFEYLNIDRSRLNELKVSVCGIGSNDLSLETMVDWVLSYDGISVTPFVDGFGVKFEGQPDISPSMQLNVARSIAMQVIFSQFPNFVFPITSERTGAASFYKELDLNKSKLMDSLVTGRRTDVPMKQSRLIDKLLNPWGRYAAPIRDNLDVIRDYELLSKQTSFLGTKEGRQFGVIEMLENVSGGNFSVDDGRIGFLTDGFPESFTPISASSSAVKSLLLLDIFFRHVAKPHSMLVIDEPELNLHPANQRKMARLLVRAVNAGIKVLITTHSDWLIRELSSCIALNKEKGRPPEELLRFAGATPADCLDPALVRAYQTTLDGILQEVRVDASGMDVSSLDDAIMDANQFYDEVRELTGEHS